MSSPTQKPSLEDVLGAFSVDPDPGRETLALYLRRYPQFAEPLIDLSRELHRTLSAVAGPESAEDETRIAAAWRRHVEAINPLTQADPFAPFSTQQLRDLAKTLDVPRQIITAFRDRRVILDSVPRQFLDRLATALNRPFQDLANSLTPAPQFLPARSYKSDAKPMAGETVTFERLLIDAGVPESKRARLLTKTD